MQDGVAERELVARIRAGEDDAVATLAASYGPRIQQLAYRYVKNREDAEEVTQDVLLKVARKIDAFRGDAALSSWIYRITFNTAISRLRAAPHMRPNEGSAPAAVSVSGDAPGRPRAIELADRSALADDSVMRREMRQRLVAALTELPLVYRVPVILRDVHGLSTEEAAAVMCVKTQTLKSRLHRGRRFLRESLVDFSGGSQLHVARAA